MKSTDERESLPGGDATCDRLRVDFVGSFLRPTILKEAFAAYDDGNLEKSELTAVADRTIEDLVAEELRHGLPVVGDGKFRRHQFMESFSEVAGMERFYAAILASPASRAIGAPLPKALELSPGKEVGGPREAVTSRLRLTRNDPLADLPSNVHHKIDLLPLIVLGE